MSYLCVSSVRPELVEYERVEESHVSRHLLHPTQVTLLLSVCKLHHKTRRRPLERKKSSVRIASQ